MIQVTTTAEGSRTQQVRNGGAPPRPSSSTTLRQQKQQQPQRQQQDDATEDADEADAVLKQWLQERDASGMQMNRPLIDTQQPAPTGPTIVPAWSDHVMLTHASNGGAGHLFLPESTMWQAYPIDEITPRRPK